MLTVMKPLVEGRMLVLCLASVLCGCHSARVSSDYDSVVSAIAPGYCPRIVELERYTPDDPEKENAITVPGFIFKVLAPARQKRLFVHNCDVPGSNEHWFQRGSKYLLTLRAPVTDTNAEESCCYRYQITELR